MWNSTRQATGKSPSDGNRRRVLPRLRIRDDLAHALLIEPLEPIVALEILEVRPERAVRAELGGLIGGDQLFGEQAVDALWVDRPALAFGERLAEVGVVGE